MSMILDALTRAEHERQLEEQPDLKFVSPVKSSKGPTKKMWLWLACGLLLANLLVFYFVVQYFAGKEEAEIQSANSASSAVVKQTVVVQDTPASTKSFEALQHDGSIPAATMQQQPVNVSPINVSNVEQSKRHKPQLVEESRPLAMEATSQQTPEEDRPLIYESKQANNKPAKTKSKSQLNTNHQSQKKGRVSFSATELTADESIPVTSSPKLLIDQGLDSDEQSSVALTNNAPKLRDLPESARSHLQQFEVNVHVYDDEPIRRFVLINMDKYKEGDRIANNGPIIEEITATGVVVDYGTGRALLPPK